LGAGATAKEESGVPRSCAAVWGCGGAAPVTGAFTWPGGTLDLALAPNDRLTLADGARTTIGFVPPHA
jgi:hypothetical protein